MLEYKLYIRASQGFGMPKTILRMKPFI